MAGDLLPTRKTIGDREAYLGFTLLMWIGVLTGFVPEIAKEGFHYPVIVHIHAMLFGGWLIFLTTQCLLIRSHRRDLHKKLGIAGAALAVAMVIVGVATAVTMDRLHYAENGKPPIFLGVQMGDIIGFVVFITAGLMLRNRAQLHKTLMMLATIGLSVAGFARGAGPLIEQFFPPGPLQFYEHIYGASDILLLLFVIYHLVSRRTLNPALLLGSALMVVLHITAIQLFFWEEWKAISLRLVGV